MSNDSEAEDADEATGEQAADADAQAEYAAEETDVDDGNGEAAEGAATEGAATEGAATKSDAAGEVEDIDSEDEEGLQDGAFVELDYTARTVEAGNLVDTTDPDVAEEEGVEADREFAPRTIVLGEGHIFPPVEEAVLGKEVGDTGSVVVEPDQAFGEYDEEEVRTVSKDKIPEDDRYPGAQVRIDGEEGFVETVIGGRARVDFNHPLAGEDIEYEYEIVGEITDRQAKAESLLETLLDLQLNVHFETDTVEEEQLVESEADEAASEGDEEPAADEEGDTEEADEEPEFETVEVEKESLYIEATPELTMNQQWMFQKQSIAQDLIDYLGVDRVVVQEIIEGMGGMGLPGMMGGMGGMGGGEEDIEAALEDADIDADELAEELGE